MITALAIGLLTTFPGGDISDLAKSIADTSRQNVVFEAGAQERAPRFDYAVEDLNEFARTVQTSTGFKRAPGNFHVFSHGKLGSWNFGAQAVPRLLNHQAWRRAGGSLPENFLNEGKVTLHSKPGEAFLLSSLPQNLLSKPLQSHWSFEAFAFKAWVTDLPAQDFLNYLAKAAGGKLVQGQVRFFLDIDPSEIARRALATLSEVQKDKRYRTLGTRDQFDVEMSRAGLASLSNAQIATLLATPGGRVRFEIPASMRPGIYSYVTAVLNGTATESPSEAQSTGRLLDSRIEFVIQSEQSAQRAERDLRGLMDQQRRGGRNSANRLMRIDPRIWGYAEMDARFRVTLQLASVPDQLGRQGPPVRLP